LIRVISARTSEAANPLTEEDPLTEEM